MHYSHLGKEHPICPAKTGPVFITDRGKPAHVLLSIEEYKRLTEPSAAPGKFKSLAASAMVHGMTVVTRNVADFAPSGVRVFNPWD